MSGSLALLLFWSLDVESGVFGLEVQVGIELEQDPESADVGGSAEV